MNNHCHDVLYRSVLREEGEMEDEWRFLGSSPGEGRAGDEGNGTPSRGEATDERKLDDVPEQPWAYVESFGSEPSRHEVIISLME